MRYTYIHTYTRTWMQIHIHTYMNSRRVLILEIHIHTYIHTYIHTWIQGPICKERLDSSGGAHTYIHTYMHTYIHEHIHTWMQGPICKERLDYTEGVQTITNYTHVVIGMCIYTYLRIIHMFICTYLQILHFTCCNGYVYLRTGVYVNKCFFHIQTKYVCMNFCEYMCVCTNRVGFIWYECSSRCALVMYVCIYIYIYIYTHVYIYIYIYVRIWQYMLTRVP